MTRYITSANGLTSFSVITNSLKHYIGSLTWSRSTSERLPVNCFSKRQKSKYFNRTIAAVGTAPAEALTAPPPSPLQTVFGLVPPPLPAITLFNSGSAMVSVWGSLMDYTFLLCDVCLPSNKSLQCKVSNTLHKVQQATSLTARPTHHCLTHISLLPHNHINTPTQSCQAGSTTLLLC